MLYLATQFAGFLICAFVIGLFMGWLGHDGARPSLRSRPLIVVAALWALAAAVSWSQILNGTLALWTETALLFVLAYFAGCALAALTLPVREPRPVLVAGTGPQPVSPQPAGAPAEAGREEDLPGRKPDVLAQARSAMPDDLKLIKGIGRQNEGRLHGLGIWHFDQIAAWTPENVEWVGGYLAFPGRIEREDWVGQAAILAGGGETDHGRRARAGEIASSRDDGSQEQDNVAVLVDGSFEGERPKNLLDTARDGKPDDLSLIKGIGPAIAADLNRLGIWHFDQIAVLREPELRYLAAFAGVPGRGAAESWREDADILQHGGETAHSRAVKAGRKPAEA